MATTAGWSFQPPPALPPVVFLDVDGVLHPTTHTIHFVPACMDCLRGIIESTGATIVVSSTWQQSPQQRAELNEALRRWGMPNFVAVTADANPGIGEEARAREIISWVRQHPDACARGWVVLDVLDLNAVAPPPAYVPVLPPRHFVRVNAQTGLTKHDALRAIEALGGFNPSMPALTPLPNAHEPFHVVMEGKGYNNTGHQAWRNDPRYAMVPGNQQLQQQHNVPRRAPVSRPSA